MNNLAKCGFVGAGLGEFGDLLFEAFGVCFVENFGANRVRADGCDQQNERRNRGRATDGVDDADVVAGNRGNDHACYASDENHGANYANVAQGGRSRR